MNQVSKHTYATIATDCWFANPSIIPNFGSCPNDNFFMQNARPTQEKLKNYRKKIEIGTAIQLKPYRDKTTFFSL